MTKKQLWSVLHVSSGPARGARMPGGGAARFGDLRVALGELRFELGDEH